ncbi:uncharacterized protein LY79DRAFT_230153 [Colletotrichum navitas]|uniref:Uncharacterized protein n=1 Tax=Colletotrichum navitas TaxID=681940 RepID=A0AAD8PXF2_9PEZI|nr:uncharacterized protein LY79DRAFT_230153 [Colletotrichum navitas]KAK1589871.1 hypothetical protein LY79DRAFT_230153 [Colletotrichum navitas]
MCLAERDISDRRDRDNVVRSVPHTVASLKELAGWCDGMTLFLPPTTRIRSLGCEREGGQNAPLERPRHVATRPALKLRFPAAWTSNGCFPLVETSGHRPKTASGRKLWQMEKSRSRPVCLDDSFSNAGAPPRTKGYFLSSRSVATSIDDSRVSTLANLHETSAQA